ncbi:MAG: helix-turn-helix domain-containing protein, partial [Ignavibacteriaceae bacterium]|nr:helix-turn-helix domain-containing protein [Ignavibacteriaceae bacterium]
VEDFNTSKYKDVVNMEDLEKIHILRVLDQNNWERVQSSLQLGISQKTLYSKIKKYKLKPNV